MGCHGQLSSQTEVTGLNTVGTPVPPSWGPDLKTQTQMHEQEQADVLPSLVFKNFFRLSLTKGVLFC